MSMIKRREFLAAALAAAACRSGGGEMPAMKWPAPVYRRQPPASPVHLSGSLVLRSGSNGSVPPAALKNPMGADMEILEIKFELSGLSKDGTSSVFGGTIGCELVMGGYKITNGSIPVWNFGRAENIEGESQVDFSAPQKTYLSYSWRLPRPLFVPAGAVLVPNFTHFGYVPQAVNVRVGYSARTVFTRPKALYVPYVAKYVSKAFNPISAPGTDVSSELDLVNPHPEVFHLQRFTGRILNIDSQGQADEIFSPGFSARVTDSYGRPIVRSFTPFRSIFGMLTRSWEMDNGTELDPEAYYLVNLRKSAITGALGAGSSQAFIGMVGWREMSL